MSFAIYKVKKEDNKKQENIVESNSISDEEKGTEMVLAISGFDTINPIITKNRDVQDINI